MAQEVDVDFSSFSISSYLDKNFVLDVSTSALLSVPVQCSSISTAADLRDQVQNGSLWIARAGSCHIELSIGFGGSLNDGPQEDIQRMCVEAFENFPVWDALGLDLRRDYNQFNEIRGSRSLYPYSVQHSQENSGLVAPDQVLCAYLSVLSCNFTFKSKSTTKAKSRATKIDTPRIMSYNFPRIAAAKRRQNCSKAQSTAPTRKSKVVTLKVLPGELRRILELPEICNLPLDLQEQRLEHLTHTALHLFLGSRKRFPGFQILKKPESITALEVAPAVWSFRYFQDVVLRAQLTSFISSALGSLVSSDSPTHQHKIRGLGLDTLQELHRRTLLLVLRSTRVPKFQVQTQQHGFQSQVVADAVLEGAEFHDPNESQEYTQERDSSATRHKEPPQDGTLSYHEAEMEADIIGTEIVHEDDSMNGSVTEMDDELAVEYDIPRSGSNSFTSGPTPEGSEEIIEFPSDQLCDGEYVVDRPAYWMQNDEKKELQDDLTVDAMSEDNAEYPVEDAMGLPCGNFEHELYCDRDYSSQFMNDTQLYGDRLGFGQHHQSYLDATLEREQFLTYRQPLYEVESIEHWEEEHGDRDYWPENNPKMGLDNFSSSYGARSNQLGYDENHMDIHYDTDYPNYAMSQPSGELEDELQHEDLVLDLNDGFANEGSAIRTIGEPQYDEAEGPLNELELSSEDAEVFDCHGGKAEDEFCPRNRLYG